MENRDDGLFETYRPFRNKLAQFNVIDSLYLIWGYSRNYTFDKEFPSDIEKPLQFNPYEPDKFARKYRGLFDHELELLEKEIILNCDFAPTKYSLKQFKHFASTVNYLRGTLEETISNKYNTVDNIILEFNRLAHRQFKWQVGYDRETIFRYYQIYSDKTLSDIISNKFNLTTQQLFLVGFFLFTWIGSNFRTALPFTSSAKALTAEMIKIFLSHFSIIPLFIYWQITSGIYYWIFNEKGFDNAFGNSFQNYVGEVLKKSCNNPTLKIIAEEKYGKPEKGTADWIITDKDSVLFIECKTKRMRLDSKSSLEITESLERDLKKMAEFIGQLYKTYLEYKNNQYPTLKYDETMNFYPLVLTLEDWYLNINHILLDKVKGFVIDYFGVNNLSLQLLEKFPYHIRCASEFERHIQLINGLGIKEYFHKTVNNLIQDYEPTFEMVDIYEGEFQKVFLAPFKDEK
ncbi:MAG: hypothetical protein IPP64_14445 [Bacteroidetes bacterium]|nr:hypothetical protein [Bacteroidota bacterium]